MLNENIIRLETCPKTPADLIKCEVETWTDGERRAHARARLVEHSPGCFSVCPFYLREVGGPNIPWEYLEPGESLTTSATFEEALETFRWWATRAVAKYASLHR